MTGIRIDFCLIHPRRSAENSAGKMGSVFRGSL